MHAKPRPASPVGLYDPANEHDACGLAFVARLNGVPTHETVQRALRALENLEHRGAAGADPNTGDGAGILLQMPHDFFSGVVPGLPQAGAYGVCVLIGRASCRGKGEISGGARFFKKKKHRIAEWWD